MLGKFGVMAGTSVLYIFTGELSPTVIRNTALSSCAMFSRVGSSVSPYLLQLGEISYFMHHTADSVSSGPAYTICGDLLAEIECIVYHCSSFRV